LRDAVSVLVQGFRNFGNFVLKKVGKCIWELFRENNVRIWLIEVVGMSQEEKGRVEIKTGKSQDENGTSQDENGMSQDKNRMSLDENRTSQDC